MPLHPYEPKVGSNRPRDNGLRFGPENGRPGQVPPPESGLTRWRALGGWIAAPLNAVRRNAAATVGAAAEVARSLASLSPGLMRREAVTALAAVIAAGAAVFACSRSVDTETRQISSELLNQFNSDDMWKARLTLERYFYLVSGDKTTPADLARLTEEYFKSFVYQKAVLTGARFADRVKFGTDREKQEEFLRQVDQSRHRVKSFYEDVMVFTESGLITREVNARILGGRFQRNAGDYLECFWLPVELGQNAALYQGRKPDTDKRACQVVDWYRKRFPVAGRPVTTCIPYATRQPDFCVDPKAEALP